MIRIGWFLVVLLLFSSCGYKPTSIYTKKVLGENIYVDVSISLTDPQNSVLITDAINEAVISKFRANLVRDKNKASSKLYVSLSSVGFTPLRYDKNGYVVSYKANVGLRTRYIDKQGNKRVVSSSGEYDFPIEANSIISDNKRFEAIKFGALKAIDELISKISIKGRNYDNKWDNKNNYNKTKR